jgi:hypothetical protein
LVLSLGGKWTECSIERRGPWLEIKESGLIESGMSGSPIVSMSGKAIGLVSTGSLNPVLLETLPQRIRIWPSSGVPQSAKILPRAMKARRIPR